MGVASGDTEKDAQYLAQKLVSLCIFPDEASRFSLSALDIKGELSVVSQFTLLADTKKSRRPSFAEATPISTCSLTCPKLDIVIRRVTLCVLAIVIPVYVVVNGDSPVSVGG